MKYLYNPGYEFVKSGFKGNKTVNGVFQNLYGQSGGNSLYQVIKWRLSRNRQKYEKDRENYKLPVHQAENILQDKDDYLLWLGHATWLIQIDGKKIITDPCLTSPPFVKRQTALPIPATVINPDYVLISHGHYDHLDFNTLRHFNKATALVPLGMRGLIKENIADINCHEAAWYQRYNLTEDFQIIFLPAHHWYRRGTNDYNKILWGSFLIRTKKGTIYFGGDSGYSQHFKDIGGLFNNIDIAILPIAAYSPRWFMKTSHINPEEAILAFKELKAKKLIPMHYGTFDLSDEPLGEPEYRLKNICRGDEVIFLSIGVKYPFSDQ